MKKEWKRGMKLGVAYHTFREDSQALAALKECIAKYELDTMDRVFPYEAEDGSIRFEYKGINWMYDENI